MLTAADLPRCELSDYIEARLARTIAEERAARATALGVHPSTVPTAHGITGERAFRWGGIGYEAGVCLEAAEDQARGFGAGLAQALESWRRGSPPQHRAIPASATVLLPVQCPLFSHPPSSQHLYPPTHPLHTHPTHTVRVVNNVTKKNEVRQRFLDAFRGEGYPEAFMYRQKVLLLFQNRDGVDLCVYCLYVQEYGDEAPEPNRKCIYLSYLDSVKYLEPEEVTAAGRGVALRTMVYHEVLLGYLAHAKQRGFLQMYIWACPPLQVG